MNVWQAITFEKFSFNGWGTGSISHRLVGLLGRWRGYSWLLQWSDALAGMLVAAVLGLAPFLPNEVLGLLLLAAGGFWLLLTLTEDRPGQGMTAVQLFVLIYWGVTVVATLLSPVEHAALKGLGKLTLYLLAFALMNRALRLPRWRTGVISAYLLAALATSAYGLRQWIFGADALATWVDPNSVTEGTTRVYSFLGNPNLLGGYLLPAVFFSVAAIFVWRGRMTQLLALFMAGANALCVILTFSRGAWLGLLLGAFTLAMLLLWWWQNLFPAAWRRWLFPVVLGGLTATLLIAVTVLEPLRVRVASIFAGRQDSSNNFRLNVWLSALEMIKDRPLLGIGPGNAAFNEVYPLYQEAKYSALSAYSIPLEIGVETGLIGFSVFIWFLLVTVNQGWRDLQQVRQTGDRQGYWLLAAIASLVGLLGHGLVDTVWYRPEIYTVWWMTVALISSWSSSTASLKSDPLPLKP
jgi:putative inorganic carbon (hco3(-)) transporter